MFKDEEVGALKGQTLPRVKGFGRQCGGAFLEIEASLQYALDARDDAVAMSVAHYVGRPDTHVDAASADEQKLK